MNTCILICQVIKNPEIRYVQDNQLAVASMFVEFDAMDKRDEQAAKPKIEVSGWGNLAAEMADVYKVGDYVIVEGRLEMNTIERDGYKEKRALLVAGKIHPTTKPTTNTYTPPQSQPDSSQGAKKSKSAPKSPAQTLTAQEQQEIDAIPF